MMFRRPAVDLSDSAKEDSVTVWDNGDIVPVDDERYRQALDEFEILTAQFGEFVITYSETFLLPEINEHESVRTVIYRHVETA